MQYTKMLDDQIVVEEVYIQKLASGYGGAAIEQLARYESMLEDLRQKQALIFSTMEQLRGEGKTKSVTFRQMMTQKLTNDAVLAWMEANLDRV